MSVTSHHFFNQRAKTLKSFIKQTHGVFEKLKAKIEKVYFSAKIWKNFA